MLRDYLSNQDGVTSFIGDFVFVSLPLFALSKRVSFNKVRFFYKTNQVCIVFLSSAIVKLVVTPRIFLT